MMNSINNIFLSGISLIHSIAAVMDRRATLEIYRCEHGHDVMKLCRQLAGNAVTLYTVTVATSQPVANYLADHPAVALMTDFFAGISLMTGGQYIQTRNVKLVSEVRLCFRVRRVHTHTIWRVQQCKLY